MGGESRRISHQAVSQILRDPPEAVKRFPVPFRRARPRKSFPVVAYVANITAPGARRSGPCTNARSSRDARREQDATSHDYEVPGVAAAEVSYGERQAIIGVTKGSQPPREAILSAIAGAGNYRGQFTDQVQWTLAIEGMTCEGCAAGLQAKLAKVPGVSSASVSYEQGQALVTADPSVGAETLREAVSAAAYSVTSSTNDGQATKSGDRQ